MGSSPPGIELGFVHVMHENSRETHTQPQAQAQVAGGPKELGLAGQKEQGVGGQKERIGPGAAPVQEQKDAIMEETMTGESVHEQLEPHENKGAPDSARFCPQRPTNPVERHLNAIGAGGLHGTEYSAASISVDSDASEQDIFVRETRGCFEDDLLTPKTSITGEEVSVQASLSSIVFRSGLI